LPGTNACIDDDRWQRFISLADSTSSGNYRLAVTLNNIPIRIGESTPNNLWKLKTANALPLRNSLTGWVPFPGRESEYIILAWDEDSGFSGSGGDYSGLLFGGFGSFSSYYYGYYGESSTSRRPFITSTLGFQSANWWILPPGVPDFPSS
jgi:hypothetical protein